MYISVNLKNIWEFLEFRLSAYTWKTPSCHLELQRIEETKKQKLNAKLRARVKHKGLVINYDLFSKAYLYRSNKKIVSYIAKTINRQISSPDSLNVDYGFTDTTQIEGNICTYFFVKPNTVEALGFSILYASNDFEPDPTFPGGVQNCLLPYTVYEAAMGFNLYDGYTSAIAAQYFLVRGKTCLLADLVSPGPILQAQTTPCDPLSIEQAATADTVVTGATSPMLAVSDVLLNVKQYAVVDMVATGGMYSARTMPLGLLNVERDLASDIAAEDMGIQVSVGKHVLTYVTWLLGQVSKCSRTTLSYSS